MNHFGQLLELDVQGSCSIVVQHLPGMREVPGSNPLGGATFCAALVQVSQLDFGFIEDDTKSIRKSRFSCTNPILRNFGIISFWRHGGREGSAYQVGSRKKTIAHFMSEGNQTLVLSALELVDDDDDIGSFESAKMQAIKSWANTHMYI